MACFNASARKEKRLGTNPPMETCNSGVFKLGKKIGTGSFGDVFLGTDNTSGAEVAVKLEHARTPHPKLLKEVRVYSSLQGCKGIPAVHWYGVQSSYNIMVLDLLGPSLDTLFRISGRKFSLETCSMIGTQLINSFEALHTKGYIHRDIKPHNFVVGLGDKSSTLYMIDFGLAKKYCDGKGSTYKHIPNTPKKSLCGTARFASVNTHMGCEQSRRDDLESLGYMLVYFAHGVLPWQGIKAPSKLELHRQIGETKQATRIEILCSGLPKEFAAYLKYCRSLDFADTPNYDRLREFLVNALVTNSEIERSEAFDWAAQNDKLYEIMLNSGSKSRGNSTAVGEIEENAPSQASQDDDGAPLCVEWKDIVNETRPSKWAPCVFTGFGCGSVESDKPDAA